MPELNSFRRMLKSLLGGSLCLQGFMFEVKKQELISEKPISGMGIQREENLVENTSLGGLHGNVALILKRNPMRATGVVGSLCVGTGSQTSQGFCPTLVHVPQECQSNVSTMGWATFAPFVFLPLEIVSGLQLQSSSETKNHTQKKRERRSRIGGCPKVQSIGINVQ